ncbi:hypothetical protein MTR_8g027915 [Medicago truncatula]|uniref:Uncharacterized protein n=1 Tax=Medicago truncatula TaxID=3880 RepID=A0A072TMQ1_MEDTR|nr:hypothetical protein MTR_8g027915 [Medicago truncatula]
MSGSVASKDFREDQKDERSIFPIWDCGSPLYDSCELVTLSHIIERQMREWPHLGGSKQIITKFSNLDEVMISNGNGKGSSKWINLSEFFEKIKWKGKNDESLFEECAAMCPVHRCGDGGCQKGKNEWYGKFGNDKDCDRDH